MRKIWRYPISESIELLRTASSNFGRGAEISPFYYDNYDLYPNGPYSYVNRYLGLSVRNTYLPTHPQSLHDANCTNPEAYFFFVRGDELLGTHAQDRLMWPLFESVDIYYHMPRSVMPAGCGFYQREEAKILADNSLFGSRMPNVIDWTLASGVSLDDAKNQYLPFNWNKTTGGQKLATLLWNGKYWSGTSNVWPGENKFTTYYLRMFWLKIGALSGNNQSLQGYVDDEGYTKTLNSAYNIKYVNNLPRYKRKKFLNIPEGTVPFSTYGSMAPPYDADYRQMGLIIQISPNDSFPEYYTGMKMSSVNRRTGYLRDIRYSKEINKIDEFTIIGGYDSSYGDGYFSPLYGLDKEPCNFGYSLNLSSKINPSNWKENLTVDDSVWKTTREIRVIKIDYNPPAPHMVKFKLSIDSMDYETQDMNILERGYGMNGGIQYLLSIPSIITSNSVSNLPLFPLVTLPPMNNNWHPGGGIGYANAPCMWTLPHEVAHYTSCPETVNYSSKPLYADEQLKAEQTDYYSIWETTIYLPHTDYAYQSTVINKVYDFNIEGTDIISKEESLYELFYPHQGHGKMIKIRFRGQRKDKFIKIKRNNILNTTGEDFLIIPIRDGDPDDNVGQSNGNIAVNGVIRSLDLEQPNTVTKYTLSRTGTNYFYMVSNEPNYDVAAIDSSTAVYYTLFVSNKQDRTSEHIGYLKTSGLADNLPRFLWDTPCKTKIEISQANTDQLGLYTRYYGDQPTNVYAFDPLTEYPSNARHYGPYSWPNVEGTFHHISPRNLETGSQYIYTWKPTSIYSKLKTSLGLYANHVVLVYYGIYRRSLSGTDFNLQNYTLNLNHYTAILYTNRDPNDSGIWSVNETLSTQYGRDIHELSKLPDRGGVDGFGSQTFKKVATIISCSNTSGGIDVIWRKIDDNEFAYLAPETVKLSFEGWDDV